MKREIPDYVLDVAAKSNGAGSARQIIQHYKAHGEVPAKDWFEYLKTTVKTAPAPIPAHEINHDGFINC